MSKTIDEKIVEMRFDNKDFEKNVSTSLSTLDKLKQKLNLTGASKGLENINTTANKINFSGMANALDSVKDKFTALDVIGITALTNITNKAVNAGMALAKSLSVDQLSAGWAKYDQQTSNVQTLVNATGKSVKEINGYLDTLMRYSDETSYGFTDMTAALSQMTSSGGDINRLVPMIMGVANATAYAGKNATEFSRVMYNLNQSYGMGYLNYMDWKSVELAGVGSKQLKQTIIDTAVEMGKLKKGAVDIGGFASSLKDKWADKEVMEAAFGKFSVAIQEAFKLVDIGEAETVAEAFDLLEGKVSNLSLTASRAAQEAKSFSEVIAYTKDAVSSNWMSIWKAIFGDYNQAKEMWTNLADTLYEHFVAPLEKFRDRIVTIMSYNPFSALIEKIENSGIGKLAGKIDSISKSLEYYQDMVNQVWRGNYKNQPYRKGLLEAEGHNYKVIQSLVNKGYKYKLTVDDIAEAEKKYGIIVEETTEKIEDLSDEKLKEAGLTEDEIKMYRELEKQAKETGKSISDIIDDMSKRDGRSLFIGGFQNIGSAMLTIADSIRHAWEQAFPPKSELQVYKLLEAFNKFTEVFMNRIKALAEDEKLEDGTMQLSRLTRTLRGLFSALHLVATFIGSGFKVVFKIIQGILSAFDISILDVTANLGDMIYNFDKWVTNNNILVDTVKNITLWIKDLVIRIKEWITNSKTLMNIINNINEGLRNGKDLIKGWFSNIKSIKDIPKFISQGLSNGFNSESNNIFGKIIEIAKGIIETFKNILGIHSPSTVFFEFGKNIVQGLANGIKGTFSFIFDIIGSLADNIIGIFNKFDFGKVVAVGIGAGLMVAAKRVSDIAEQFVKVVDNVTKPLAGLGNMLTGFGSAASSFGVAAKDFAISLKRQSIASIIKSLALAIGILAASVYFLSKIEPSKLWSTIGAIAVLGTIIAGLSIAVMNLSKSAKSVKGTDTAKIALSLIGISTSILILSIAMKKLANIDPGKMWQGIGALAAIIGGMVVLLTAMSILVKKGYGNALTGAGKMMIKLSFALLIMVAVIKLAGTIKPTDLVKAMGVLTLFGIFAAGLIAVSQFAGEYASKAGSMLLRISFALLIMVAVIKLAGLIKGTDLVKAMGVLTLFGIFAAALIAMSFLAGQYAGRAGWMLLSFSVAVLILVGVIKLIGLLEVKELVKGITVIGILSLFIAGLIAVSKFAGRYAMNAGVMLMSVATSLAVLVAVIFILSKIDPDQMWRGVAAVSILEVMYGMIIGLSHFAKDCKMMIITLTTSIALLVAAVVGLSFIDPERLKAAAGGLSVIMAAFGTLIASTKFIKTSKGTLKNLYLMLPIVLALSGVIAALTHIQGQESVLKSASAISLLLLALSGSLIIINKIRVKSTSWKTIGMLGTLILVVAGLAGALALMGNTQNSIKNAIAISILLGVMTGVLAVAGLIGNYSMAGVLVGVAGLAALTISMLLLVQVLKQMDGLQNAITNALALSILLGALTVAFVAISLVGNLWIGVIAGVIGLAAVMGELFIVVNVLKEMENLSNAITNALALSILLQAMSDALFKLALVGPLALVADIAIFGLIGAITTIGTLATIVGALTDKFPQLEQFLDKGLPILEKIALGIGKILGNVLGGFMSGVSKSLPEVGTNLSMFMLNATPFIVGTKMVDDRTLNGVKVLTSSILALTGANIVEKIGSFITGGESFSRLGSMLSEFITNAMPFITGLSTVDSSILTGSESLAKAVLIFTAGNFVDALTSKIFGSEKSLSNFGSQLGLLGTGISSFATNVGTFDEKKANTVECASNAIKSLAEAANSIPNEGGWLETIIGSNSFSEFGNKLPDLATHIKNFVANLGTFEKPQIDTVKCAGEAIVALAKAANEIPNEGGLAAFFAGDNSIKEFADKLPGVGTAIKGFVDNLGENGFGKEQIESVDSAIKILQVMTNMSSKDVNIKETGKNLEGFGNNFIEFAGKLKSFVDSLNEIKSENLENAAEKTDNLLEVTNKIKNADYDALNQFSDSLKKLSEDGFKSFIDTFSNDKHKADAKKAIEDLISIIISVTDSGEVRTNISNSFTSICDLIIATLNNETKHGEVIKAGRYFVDGFVQGINENIDRVITAGTNLGNKALEAAKKAIDSNSPSKETHKLGNYFGLGFINGIKEYYNKAYDESYDVAYNARMGLAKAISRVSDIIENDIDGQPTIRPILDLSEVESGVGTLGSMFNSPSIGVMSNLSAISSGMNSRSQNGGEVVSAIDRLRKDLGNTNGDTYNINGITYDDGSNVSEAVRTLVRAANIERRV